MTRTCKSLNSFAGAPVVLAQVMFCAFVFAAASLLHAQAASRYLGSITAINGTTLTVKTDAGDPRQVEVPSTASIKRIEPGEKDLSKAATITFGDLAVGDRVLVRLDPNATGATPQAVQIIAVKKEDLAQRQQQEREEWQKRGVGGLVKSLDPATGTILLTTGAGTTAKTVTVHTTNATVLKRYAPGSVRFDQAQPAPLTAIHPGDQLRARGEKNPDGTEISAEEVVSGSFRNISGTISSVDAANSTMTVKDLTTKKQVTIKVTPDSQMRRLPERMAQVLAARLKGGSGNSNSAGPGAPGRPGAVAPPAGAPAQRSNWNGGQGAGSGGGQWQGERGAAGGPGGPGAPGSGDPQQMLSRAPAIQLSDLQKGEAVMLVSTEGANDVTAITLLAGVEPLLEAPAASQNLLSNWSMGSGGGGEGAAPQ
jgi:hypothetical protein